MDKPSKPFSSNHHERAAQSMENFVLYVSSPWRVVWVNFIAGIFRGLGTVIGATIVIAIIVWVLSLFTQIPFVGEYAGEVEEVITGYVHETNYNDELNRVDATLVRIEQLLQKQTE